MDVRVVAARQLANATPCQACILELLKNGITALNDGKPGDYTARSHAEIWWKLRDQRSWLQSIKSRSLAAYSHSNLTPA